MFSAELIIHKSGFQRKGVLFTFFLLLSSLVFANLNGILESLTGRGELGSPLILLSALSILYLIPVKKAYVRSFFLVFSLLTGLYLLFGWASGIWYMDEGNFTMGDAKLGTRQLMTSYIIFSAYYFLFVWAKRTGESDIFLKTLFYLFLIVLLAGILEDYLGLRKVLYQRYTNTRNLGFFGNPNETGMQANLAFVLVVWAYYKKYIRPWTFIILMGLCTYGVLSSFSRTAIVTNAILILFFLGYLIFGSVGLSGLRYQPKRWFFFFLIIGIVVSSFQFVAIPFYNNLKPNQRKRIDAVGNVIFKRQFNNKTTALRAGIFDDAVKLIKKRPLRGYGLHTFSKGGMFPTSPSHGVHNMYLKVMGEAGIIPGLLYLWLIFVFLAGFFRSPGPSGMVISMFGLCIALYSFASHGVFAQKFIAGLIGVFGAFLVRPHNGANNSTNIS